ncbi:exonuclease domain-containing protein [Photobacterium minamisatsumaniensis]|uniref:3'-5' exonuclease n=1 Tax=Photobacterium minamisatsumaniensis TaxID=2910233 RepID=UPI003D14399F
MKSMFSMFKPLNRLEKARVKWLGQQRVGELPPVIESLANTRWVDNDLSLNDVDFLVLDFETTGLSPNNDQILSIGYVELSLGALSLETSHETYIKDSSGINATTAIINHITPEMLKQGQSLDTAMEALFERMQGKVVLVHGLTVEKFFIENYVKTRYGITFPPVLWLDTLLLEKSMAIYMHNKEEVDYRLSSIRERYGLPQYPCHGALIDAVATGELFLAMVKKMFGTEEPKLSQVYDVKHFDLTLSS